MVKLIKCFMKCMISLVFFNSNLATQIGFLKYGLPNLSSWCLVMVERLFLAVPRGCLWFVIVEFPDHTHLLFFYC